MRLMMLFLAVCYLLDGLPYTDVAKLEPAWYLVHVTTSRPLICKAQKMTLIFPGEGKAEIDYSWNASVTVLPATAVTLDAPEHLFVVLKTPAVCTVEGSYRIPAKLLIIPW